MKKTFLFFALLGSLNLLNAQIYPKGSVNVSAGYGAVVYSKGVINFLTSDLKNFKKSYAGPMYFKGEYAVADNFTLGLNVNFTNITGTFTLDSLQTVDKYSGSLGIRSTSFIARANYTFPFAEDKGGFMLGGGLGYRHSRLSYADNNPQTPVDGGIGIPLPFTFELTMGMRYYFTENIGFYIESGITRSLIQGGLTVRF